MNTTTIFNGQLSNGAASNSKEIMLNKNSYKACYGQKETLRNVEGVKKVHKEYYRYYKPTFYVFLEQYF